MAQLGVAPVLPVAVIAVATVLLGAFACVQFARAPRGARRRDWALRLVMLALLVIIAIRPNIPADRAAPASSGGLEVYFLVDTTSSMAAEDWPADPASSTDGGVDASAPAATRLDGARADIDAILGQLAGAEYSLTTVDSTALQRVPLTTDATAVSSAAAVLTPEVTFYSRGSAIDAAVPFMTELLADAQQADPGQRRVLFYLGDGEQTADAAPGSFAGLAPYLSGGAVLGYGSDDGGEMRVYDGFAANDDPAFPRYIQDPATGRNAVSIPDEANLRAIAGQLGVGYDRREPGEAVDAIVSGIEVGESTEVRSTPDTPTEFYWLLAIPLALLGVREAAGWALTIAETRPGRES